MKTSQPDLNKIGHEIYHALRSSGRRGYKYRARKQPVKLEPDKLYTPGEVASLLNVSYDSAVRQMLKMKGHVDLGTETRRYKRRKRMLRISGKHFTAFLRSKTKD
jgi:hypothetical protein